jgi:signal transduction histidine kinase
MLQGALVALAFSLILAFLVARWIADPLQRVVSAARGFPSVGPQTVRAGGPREVQDLTRAFNSMVGRVQASQRSQREFVANVSHELKTPLTSIEGFAQALLDGTADTPEARRQAAEVIHAEAGRMHRMVLDLLDLARLESGTADLELSRLDAPGLLGGIAEKFTPQAAAAGVALDLDLRPGLPAFSGDGDRLAQVLNNLVDNALKFTPRGGTVTLRAAADEAEMHFEVQDTGHGISEADQGRIFERFYQADAARSGGAGRGAGLGLAIVREIVGAHGGRISVRSRPGLGTTFRFSLPLAASADTLRTHHKR